MDEDNYLGFTISMCHLAVKIRGTFQAHWNKITHLCIMIKTKNDNRFISHMDETAICERGAISIFSHRYHLDLAFTGSGPPSVGYL